MLRCPLYSYFQHLKLKIENAAQLSNSAIENIPFSSVYNTNSTYDDCHIGCCCTTICHLLITYCVQSMLFLAVLLLNTAAKFPPNFFDRRVVNFSLHFHHLIFTSFGASGVLVKCVKCDSRYRKSIFSICQNDVFNVKSKHLFRQIDFWSQLSQISDIDSRWLSLALRRHNSVSKHVFGVSRSDVR